MGALGSFLLWWKFRRIDYPILFLMGEIFIDLDHFIDYFIFAGFKFNLKDFFNSVFLTSGKVYVFFHSWELVLLLIMGGFFLRYEPLFILSGGMTVHLLVDQFQRYNRFFYFLIYRKKQGFKVASLCPEFRSLF